MPKQIVRSGAKTIRSQVVYKVLNFWIFGLYGFFETLSLRELLRFLENYTFSSIYNEI